MLLYLVKENYEDRTLVLRYVEMAGESISRVIEIMNCDFQVMNDVTSDPDQERDHKQAA